MEKEEGDRRMILIMDAFANRDGKKVVCSYWSAMVKTCEVSLGRGPVLGVSHLSTGSRMVGYKYSFARQSLSPPVNHFI